MLTNDEMSNFASLPTSLPTSPAGATRRKSPHGRDAKLQAAMEKVGHAEGLASESNPVIASRAQAMPDANMRLRRVDPGASPKVSPGSEPGSTGGVHASNSFESL